GQAMYIPSSSMEPTLQIYDVVLVNKLDKDIQRGDLIIFKTNKMYDGDKALIKRVVGLPGENIMIKGNQLFINGEVYAEDYLKDPNISDFGPMVVPENEYLLLGDNRNLSYDSRYFGTIPSQQIIGKSILTIPLSSVVQLIK
ncbi:MAG: signal peptidase I, partial [Bacillota bacterium]|nr:signal peptidase I [Bacillota bacterium]